jgi:hypothetical protein
LKRRRKIEIHSRWIPSKIPDSMRVSSYLKKYKKRALKRRTDLGR